MDNRGRVRSRRPRRGVSPAGSPARQPEASPEAAGRRPAPARAPQPGQGNPPAGSQPGNPAADGSGPGKPGVGTNPSGAPAQGSQPGQGGRPGGAETGESSQPGNPDGTGRPGAADGGRMPGSRPDTQRGDGPGNNAAGGRGDGSGMPGKPREKTGTPPPVAEPPPANPDDVPAPDSGASLAIRKIQDLIKDDKFTPDVERQLGMTKEEAAELAKKYDASVKPKAAGAGPRDPVEAEQAGTQVRPEPAGAREAARHGRQQPEQPRRQRRPDRRRQRARRGGADPRAEGAPVAGEGLHGEPRQVPGYGAVATSGRGASGQQGRDEPVRSSPMIAPLDLPRRYLVGFDPRDLAHHFADVLIIGGGVAGLRAALGVGEPHRVMVVTKDEVRESNSTYAQGGIAGVLDPEDRFDDHIADTLAAGKGLCDEAVVDQIVREAPERIAELIAWGTEFDRVDGQVALGARGRPLARADRPRAGRRHGPRGDARRDPPGTGAAEPADLAELVHDRPAHARGPLPGRDRLGPSPRAEPRLGPGDGARHRRRGQLYRETTNPTIATGDGLAVAFRAGAELRDMEFMQFHPTVLYIAGSSRHLLTEALRGEGAYLRDRNGHRFMPDYHPDAELAPRDDVSKAIVAQMARTQHPNVYLDLSHLDPAFVRERFPGIAELCRGLRPGHHPRPDPRPPRRPLHGRRRDGRPRRPDQPPGPLGRGRGDEFGPARGEPAGVE